jgi:hypothetical protein
MSHHQYLPQSLHLTDAQRAEVNAIMTEAEDPDVDRNAVLARFSALGMNLGGDNRNELSSLIYTALSLRPSSKA